MDLMEGRAHSFRRFQSITVGKIQQIGAVSGHLVEVILSFCATGSATVAALSPLQQPLPVFPSPPQKVCSVRCGAGGGTPGLGVWQASA